MGKKYYGVRYGDGGAEVFSDWEACKVKIKGEKGVSYKGFLTEKEAHDFASGSTPSPAKIDIDARYAIYVDGSFKDDIYSYGFVLVDLKTDKPLVERRGRGVDKEAAALRNVSGEMKGAMEAVKCAISLGIVEITLCYDYLGIEKWAKGEWKRNNELTKKYYKYMKSKEDRIKVYFHKVKGHSGNKWNDLADTLAKEGLNLQE